MASKLRYIEYDVCTRVANSSCTHESMAWNLFNNARNQFYHRKTGFTTVKPVCKLKNRFKIDNIILSRDKPDEKTVYQSQNQFINR